MEKSNSYKQIVKATGIFGGVQFVNIILSIIRSKFVAVLLGTGGVGLMGLFTATTNMIASISNLGIGFSAVRTISESSALKDETLLSRTIITLKRWVNFTGMAGAFITLALSQKLSEWTFGSEKYTWAFIWLSVTLLLQALTSGQLALLQGLRKLKQLAKANVLGSFLGLCLSLPLYYFFKIEGIVPAIIITACINLILSWYFSRAIIVEKTEISLKQSFKDGIDMAKLGSVVMITGFASAGVMYLIRMYVGRTGGLEQVGLYAAAWAILSGYVDMVFTAMGTDYFPRLSEVNSDNQKIKKLVNEQAEMAVLILGPILLLMFSSLPILVKILLTNSFLPVIGLIQWALIGILFKAGSWSVAFILLAKGDRKLYFISEMISNVITLGSSILLYHFFKLNGLGIAFLVSYVLYLTLVFFIAKIKYNFAFDKAFLKLFLIQFILTSAAFAVVLNYAYPIAYIPSIFLLTISSFYSYSELKKRIDIPAILTSVKSKFSK
ncbi:MAG: O-antigen translocase [Chitinophagaceae bacterium]|nr:O-antigen translocase [Chitinophagaceae bacterium]